MKPWWLLLRRAINEIYACQLSEFYHIKRAVDKTVKTLEGFLW